MKKILALMVVFGMGAFASVAQAQDKKSYVILGYGAIAASGGETIENEGGSTTEYTEAGGYLRLGYGYYLNENLSLELSIIDIAGINQKTSFGAISVESGFATLSSTEFAAVYYKPLNEKTNLTLRGGLVSYSWASAEGEAVSETGDAVYSGTTPVLGVGIETGNWQFELAQYDFTLTLEDGTNVYTGPMVLSAGYKFRF